MKNRHWLKFVRSLPCAVCGHEPCDAHHRIGGKKRGVGIKVSDYEALPLCRKHHNEIHQYGHETFETEYMVSQVEAVLETLLGGIHSGALAVDKNHC